MDVTGLTDREVKERKDRKEVNSVETQVSRTYKDIIVKNVCTTFNLILFALGAVFILLEEYTNALATTGIITLNIIIATIQEIKAKRRLDKIALLLRPKVRIVREHGEIEVDQNEIVKDDVIHLMPGDQALVDGILISTYNLEMDESLLTGESSTVRKKTDDNVFSGSFCITGEGYFRVTAFGSESYASQMLATARKFESKATPLQRETGIITKVLMVIAFVYMAVAIAAAVLGGTDLSRDGLVSAAKVVAIILDIVPIALFLMIVIAYMVAALRMADSGVLLQQSNAVESMSHVDTVCMDKTGTITTNNLVFEELIPLTSDEDAEHYLKIFATATGSKNRTIEAVINQYGTEETELLEEVLFSSERKYSAVRIRDDNKVMSLYMGAPSILNEYLVSGGKRLSDAILENSRKGLRTVMLAKGGRNPLYENERPIIPQLKPIALITIRDEIRPDCRETIEVFLENRMDLKVISGDDPETVNAIFSLADIPGDRKIISGDEYNALAGEDKVNAVLETNIFGRMKPDNKEEIINILKDNGRYVAMVGDGVNDVKALKKAQVGVALQSGSSAARGVADIVLMNDKFSALPKALVEGKRTVSGMRDILKFYLTRNFVLAIIIPLILIIFGSVPFLPTSSAFYAFVSVSVAAFLMVIWAQPSDEKGPVLPSVLRFAIPSAIMLAAFGLGVYVLFFLGSSDTIGFFNIDYMSLYGADIFSQLSWNGDISDPMAATQEINARNAMLLFLTTAGVIQIFFIAPPFKFFSVNGKTTKDYRPFILGLLLLLLIFVVYGQNDLLHFLYMASLEGYRPIVYLIVLLWFFTARTVLRTGRLSRFTRMTENAFNKAMEHDEEEEQKNKAKEEAKSVKAQ